MSESNSPDIEQAEATETSQTTEHSFPGQLTVWETGTPYNKSDAFDAVPEGYVLVHISTPISDSESLIPVSAYECGLHPYPVDAAVIYRNGSELVSVFPIDDSTHLTLRHSLRKPIENVTIHAESAPDPDWYATNTDGVVWTAPQADAAFIDA